MDYRIHMASMALLDSKNQVSLSQLLTKMSRYSLHFTTSMTNYHNGTPKFPRLSKNAYLSTVMEECQKSYSSPLVTRQPQNLDQGLPAPDRSVRYGYDPRLGQSMPRAAFEIWTSRSTDPYLARMMRQSEEGGKDNDDWTVYRTKREQDRYI